jgi:hypothetical protein
MIAWSVWGASTESSETHTGPLKLPGTKPRQETLTTLYESPGVTWGHMSNFGLIVGHSSVTGAGSKISGPV